MTWAVIYAGSFLVGLLLGDIARRRMAPATRLRLRTKAELARLDELVLDEPLELSPSGEISLTGEPVWVLVTAHPMPAKLSPAGEISLTGEPNSDLSRFQALTKPSDN